MINLTGSNGGRGLLAGLSLAVALVAGGTHAQEKQPVLNGVDPDGGFSRVWREYEDMDAMKRLDLTLPDVPPLAGCRCGDVLKGRITPPACPLFGKKCTPATPVGPCMVSTEGSCAAYFKYSER